MTERALELAGVSKRFGSVEALVGVDLALDAGEFLVVLGPTGAGKTTLLRTIAGLEVPDAGNVRLFGRDAELIAPAQRDVALVFQNFSLYPSSTVRENLAFPLRAPSRRLSAAEIDERVQWAARLLHVERLLDRPAKKLSGGEMQRVAIGRAIVRKPKLFLMDEPLNNLDAKLREELRVELRELARELRTPVVWVTHDQAEALTMADRVALFVAGRVVQTGTPEAVYARPVSPLAARLLGTPPMNVIAVRRVDGAWTTDAGHALARAASVAPERATLGIRPEHVRLEGGAAEAVVLVVEDWGPERVLLARLGTLELHVLAPRDCALRAGDRFRPALDERRIVLWDPAPR
ncbi:MAG: ABC transporter ATP-binding protein [Planctomycetes bacterium]|nr:ABC transporter ATP-binding protein [Planctomycetota bacterium]